MSLPVPNHYTSLKPWRKLFESGRPYLMYHKIATQPRGARIRGLYLAPSRLEQQFRDLAEAGFGTPDYGQLPKTDNRSHAMALTFDDGFASAFDNALAPLAKYSFCAIQFLVADRIGQFNEWEVQLGELREPLMDAAQVRDWIAAGHEIGAHSLTHPYLTRVSFREAREEVFSCKKKLEDLFGVPVRHFSYPYGDWNEAVCDLVQEAGFATACTTETGVNTQENSPWTIRRIMARHRSISLKSIKATLSDNF